MKSTTQFSALLAGLLMATTAAAQQCPPGQVQDDDTRGHCCWPGQRWSRHREECSGRPECPAGFVRRHERCVATESPAPQPAPAAPVVIPDAPPPAPPAPIVQPPPAPPTPQLPVAPFVPTPLPAEPAPVAAQPPPTPPPMPTPPPFEGPREPRRPVGMRFTSGNVDRDFEVSLSADDEGARCRTPCVLPTESQDSDVVIRDLRDGRVASQRLHLASDLHARLSRRSPVPWVVGGGALAAAGIAAISVGAALDVANARAGGQDHRATIALVVPGSVAVIGGALLIVAPWTFLSTFRVERERVSRPGWSGVSLSPRAEGGVDLGVAGRF